jgi:dolichol-phosphate mannosyltransferase
MTSDGHIWHSESSPDLAVVIPAWNERENIELLLPALKEMVADLGLKAEIIVADGGSRDGTGAAAERRGARGSTKRDLSFPA